MKKKLSYFGLILLAILLQTSFLPIFMGANVVGDAVLMLVLTLAVLDGFTEILIWAIVAGVLTDFVAFVPVGQHVLVFLLVVYVVSFFSRRLSVEVKGTGILLFLLFIIIATLSSNVLMTTFLVLENNSIRLHPHFLDIFKITALQIGGNSVLFFLWYNFVKKIKRTFLGSLK